MTPRRWWTMWAAITAFGCASSEMEPASSAPAALESCTAAWKTLFRDEADNNFAPQSLRFHDGTLYYMLNYGEHGETVTPPQLVSLAAVGDDTPQTLAEDQYARELWVEGDQVLFAGTDRLYAVPTRGGAVSTIVDGETFNYDNPDSFLSSISSLALDESHLYLLVWEDNANFASVWRVARTGGRSERIVQLPQERYKLMRELVLLPDEQLLAASSSGQSLTVPKSGGEVTMLPDVKDGILEGWSTAGTLWSSLRDDGDAARRVVSLARPGSAKLETLWDDKPTGLQPSRAYYDEATDEWISTALEPFSDGRKHFSVWSLDARGHNTRLACDPLAHESGMFPSAGALSADAAYIAMQRKMGWDLVSITR